MKTLIILNDPPYGTERSYNGLRLAMSLCKQTDTDVRLFLMADSSFCGKSGQTTPNGYYNIERMLKPLSSKNIPIGACGSCMDARGLKPEDLIPGVHKSSMDELTEWTVWAGKGIRGDELPEELRYKESRLRKIKDAMRALEREASEKPAQAGQARRDEKRSRKKRQQEAERSEEA